ncbi:hypothetical protein FGO68_gene7396 [Halteria grandinella]|uniref:Uncharacterized protein n=1 Tax=Halteria grandinella TaxID=5974 RepID=A0A8J8SYE8_HALGN|nr:hypothetical protein FGO68_gene7396 [Halteria grandinella]
MINSSSQPANLNLSSAPISEPTLEQINKKQYGDQLRAQMEQKKWRAQQEKIEERIQVKPTFIVGLTVKKLRRFLITRWWRSTIKRYLRKYNCNQSIKIMRQLGEIPWTLTLNQFNGMVRLFYLINQIS